MGNNFQSPKFNKYIDFYIKLDKICYFPGENISGTLFLTGKPGLMQTQFTDPKVVFTIYEIQTFYIPNSNNKTIFEENKNKNEQFTLFNNYIGANLLTGISIPFTYQIPTTIHPTCSFLVNSALGYSKHFFTVELPNLNLKRALLIVIKNNANFTNENNLLQMPCKFFKTISKSKFLVNKGEFSITVNLPKNVFYFDEPIPFEIFLDCKNLDLIINKIDISLIRKKRHNNKSNFNKIRNSENNILITIRSKLKRASY